MRLRPFVWGLAGGLVGLTFGLFVIALRLLDSPAPSLSPRIPGAPKVAAAPPAGGGYAGDIDSAFSATMTVQKYLKPLVDSGQIDQALGAIRDLGEGEIFATDFSDQNLSWLARSLVGLNADDLVFGANDTLDELGTGAPWPDAPPVPLPGPRRERQVGTRPPAPSPEPPGPDRDGTGGEDGGAMPAAVKDDRGAAARTAVGLAPAARGAGRNPGTTRTEADFAKAEEVAAQIRSPLIRAETLADLADARAGHHDPAVKKGSAADLQKAFDALKAAARGKTSSASLAQALDPRNAVWLAGPGLLGVILFGLGARGLNALGDRFQRGMAADIDREVAARLKARTS